MNQSKMNKHKIIFVFSLVFFCFSAVQSQTSDTEALEEIEFAKKMTFDMGTDLFKSKKLFFNKNTQFITPWDKNTDERKQKLKTALNTIIENSTIELKARSSLKKSIIFNSKIQEIDDLTDIFSLKWTETNLVDSNSEIVNIRERGTTFYGSIFNSSIKEGKKSSSNQITIKSTFKVAPKTTAENITGSVTFLASFPSDYEKVLITKEAVGKNFNLGGEKFTVVNIIENKLFLKFHEKDSKAATAFKFVNLDKDGKEITQLSYNELEKLKEENNALDITTMHGTEAIPEEVYSIFLKNPSISEEEFNAVIKPWTVKMNNSKGEKRLFDKMFEERYIVATSPGPIQNCYLYIENHGIRQEFKKEL